MKRKLNLLEGELHCCGALCDKRKAQQHIDRMQAVINKCNSYFAVAGYYPPKYDEMVQELKELTND